MTDSNHGFCMWYINCTIPVCIARSVSKILSIYGPNVVLVNILTIYISNTNFFVMMNKWGVSIIYL